MIAQALAATAHDSAHAVPLWQEPEIWLLVAFAIFVGLVAKPAWQRITGGLDDRAGRIQAELDEARRLREEAKVLDRELVVTPVPGRLRPKDAQPVLDQLLSMPSPEGQSFVVARLIRALRHFDARRRVVEVVEHLASESRADDQRVDASYGLVRVFVWAVPTLGFIGTVIGIGAAVGGFSDTLEAASSLESMKESIGSVTGQQARGLS